MAVAGKSQLAINRHCTHRPSTGGFECNGLVTTVVPIDPRDSLPSTAHRGASLRSEHRTTIKRWHTTLPIGAKGAYSSSVLAANTASAHSISTPVTATSAPRALRLLIGTPPRRTTSRRPIRPSILISSSGVRDSNFLVLL